MRRIVRIKDADPESLRGAKGSVRLQGAGVTCCWRVLSCCCACGLDVDRKMVWGLRRTKRRPLCSVNRLVGGQVVREDVRPLGQLDIKGHNALPVRG